MSDIVLEVKNLVKSFPIMGGLFGREVGKVCAVNDVSFSIQRGETLGLVGESGCGKTTLGRTILRLLEPTQGSIIFDGQDITHLELGKMREMRKQMQIIFQDPYASLNPRMTIEATLLEPLRVHNIFSDRNMERKRLFELLDQVKLSQDSLNKYPHEFSGGATSTSLYCQGLSG